MLCCSSKQVSQQPTNVFVGFLFVNSYFSFCLSLFISPLSEIILALLFKYMIPSVCGGGNLLMAYSTVCFFALIIGSFLLF